VDFYGTCFRLDENGKACNGITMDIEPSYFARLWEFCSVVLANWYLLVTGGVFVIGQFLDMLLPRRWSDGLNSRFPKERRRTLLLVLCAGAFVYASFAAYDDVNTRLRASQERLLQYASEKGLPGDILTDEQRDKIARNLAVHRNDLGALTVGAFLTSGSVLFSISLIEAIERSGIPVKRIFMQPDGPDQTGVMVSCEKPDIPPPMASWLAEGIGEVGVGVRIVGLLKGAKKLGADECMLFIGPGPFFEEVKVDGR
jgi:hypothetical protein